SICRTRRVLSPRRPAISCGGSSSPLERLRGERVAGAGLAAAASRVEPVLALTEGAVREGVGVHAAGGLALQAVVTDRRGGVERLLDVARLEVAGLVDRVRPDARVAVGLQL